MNRSQLLPIQSLFDNFLAPTLFRDTELDQFAPVCDFEEFEDHYLMSVDLPGVPKDAVTIELSGNMLTLTGERKSEKNTQSKGRHLIERSYGRFSRSFKLPQDVDTEKVQAHSKDGVFTLQLPKAEKLRPRQIKVNEL